MTPSSDNSSYTSLDLNIIGLLVSAGNVVLTLPDEEKAGAFSYELLRKVPGISGIRIYTRWMSGPVGDRFKACSTCSKSDLDPALHDFNCPVEEEVHGAVLRLQAASELFGHIVIAKTDEKLFQRYLPFFTGFINIYSLKLDNLLKSRSLIKRNQKLEEYQEHLEDIINRRTTELAASEKKYRLLVETLHEGIWATGINGQTTFINPRMASMLGYERSELIGMKYADFTEEKDEDRPSVRAEGFIEEYQEVFRRKDGSLMTCAVGSTPIFDHLGKFSGSLRGIMDITDQIDKQNKIEELLGEKEIILKEVHHRIKNNMTTLQSVLALQGMRSENTDVAEALQSAQSRIQTMQVLYSKLYQSDNFSRTNLKDYFESLLLGIRETAPPEIKITWEIIDLELSQKVVLPMGILSNEIISNSLKYAFTAGKEGVIDLSFSKNKNGFSLIIRDNGCGLKKDQEKGFGLELVDMLTQQLSGELKVSGNNGTSYCFTFSHKISQ